MNVGLLIKKLIKPIGLILASVIFFSLGYSQVGLLFAIIYFIDNFYQLNNYWKKEQNINQFTKDINKAIECNVASTILPIALISESGNIMWHNDIFDELKSGKNFAGENILSIARGLNLNRILESDKDLHQRLKLNGRLYDVYSKEIFRNNKRLFLVYFNDISEFIGLDTTKESIMLIEVDNFNEALDTTDDADKPLVIAEIDREINSYAHRLEAMVKKYENNMYVLSIQDKYIDEEINDKFSILDKISNINKGNKLEITLSIGVGRGGMSPEENHNFAVVAKELSLGRGGDQAVIKSGDGIKIFGGNTKEIEKRTRVRARVVSHALKELIYESSKVYIMGHKNPDMDCFGSSVGMASVIKQLGKPCSIVLDDDTSAIEYYLNELKRDSKYANLVETSEAVKKEMDDEALFIIVDVHNRNYVNNLKLVEQAKRKVIIDHHRRSADIIEDTLLNYIEVYASSTSEMVTEIIQYMVERPNLTELEAEGLLAGIYMDTKGFSFKTGVRTFEAASFLRKSGAETTEVKKMFTDNLTDFIQISDIIKSAEIENKIAIAVCPDTVRDTVIIAKSADELLNISGILASFVLADIDGSIYISARSIGEINVQIVLEALGGGGHMNMAGAKISNEPIEKVVEDLKDAMKKYLRVGE
ncbi:delta-lactam-biosynthetic de-N-acetylase [Clostridium baratii]|uniref:DHH family phosphoesterase n=1 Tax=Clostridium baratii TaxID=1561 RepID=UPI0009A2EAE4|nr:DHH family phosphoesterase [Clostridium baratii]OPF52286.1 delta-lactam-biosynthetic de-N-acetylase [Clostridium baratii]OPF56419.1 delta-lactam-biosynthetic de-N-acetylase [Clostridium baratii]OPF57830.1 delta-lactam-biosynthetic de-N-acetylase [Clostridium baratii]OPF61347.1 delta-lactam-biosynthetic de-N-acetylase [Clostridium baratii]